MDDRVKWWERFLVNWATLVMTDEGFDAFLVKYNLAISESLTLVRRHHSAGADDAKNV